MGTAERTAFPPSQIKSTEGQRYIIEPTAHAIIFSNNFPFNQMNLLLLLLPPIQQLLQLPTLIHTRNNITPPHKLPIHIQLRNRRPLRILLDALPHLRVIQNIHGRKIGSVLFEGADDRGGEAALGCGGGAFHVEHDAVGFDVVVDHGVDGVHVVVGEVFLLGGEVIVGVGELAA